MMIMLLIDGLAIKDIQWHPSSPGSTCKGFRVRKRLVNSPSPGQNGRNFADYIFKCIFVNEEFNILIKISLKFVLKGPIDNNPALV